MRQLIQTAKNGAIEVLEVPPPILRPGGALVRTRFSLISAGTERQRLELARKSLVSKARARPDLVRQVFQRARQDGVVATYRRVKQRLDSDLTVGYSTSGVVIAVASDVSGIRLGDRVACAGAGYANHAEINFVPKNLCAVVPEELPLDHACFGTLGAIAMHGLRQADVAIGETVAVVGLGLVGLLAVSIAKAAGCCVIGADPVAERRQLALQLGADAVAADNSEALTSVHSVAAAGADAVLVCASSSSSDPMHLAGELARDRARIVVIGAVRLEIPRQAYYEKELSVLLSRSYGPGRYDPNYEVLGHEYPIGYVRWTEGRNLQGFIDLVSRQPAMVTPLISTKFALERGAEAYEVLVTDPSAVGVLLEYQEDTRPAPRRTPLPVRAPTPKGTLRVGIIGAGNFAQGVFLPELARRSGVSVRTVATASGLSARRVAERYGASYATNDYAEVLADPEVDCVAIFTRHDSHEQILAAALRAGKIAFVEKPLATSHEGLDIVVAAAEETGVPYIVGFNRRYSPMLVALRKHFAKVPRPLVMSYRVNAGPLPADHWLSDPHQGGRAVGEICHFIDSLQFLAASRPAVVSAVGVGNGGDFDDVSVTVRFADGSVGSVLYTTVGDQTIGKERIEVFGSGAVAVIEDFRSCSLTTRGLRARLPNAGAGKGHREEVDAFLMLARGEGEAPPIREWVATTVATLAILDSLTSARPVILT